MTHSVYRIKQELILMPPAGTTTKGPMIATDSNIESMAISEAAENFDADSVMVIPVNEETKKLRQILSNETSMKIWELLKKESLSAGEVADRLEIPLTTVKYNIDQMVEHDLIRIRRIKYSEKGRQVKIYEAPEKIIIFAPEKMNRLSLISMIQKYAFAFIAAAFAGFGLSYLYNRHWKNPAVFMKSATTNTSINYTTATEEAADTAMDAAATGGGLLEGGRIYIHDAIMSFNDWFFGLMTHHAFWFILGALFVCVIIWVIEYATVKQSVKSE